MGSSPITSTLDLSATVAASSQEVIEFRDYRPPSLAGGSRSGDRDGGAVHGMSTNIGSVTSIEDVHHLGLTVSDVEASAAWYIEVLGFERVGDFAAPAGDRRKIFLRHPGLRARLGLVQHLETTTRRFDETQIGLDHLAFRVASRASLQSWAERLALAGVSFSPVADSLSIVDAAVLVFRDPDNIQLEFFADPNQ